MGNIEWFVIAGILLLLAFVYWNRLKTVWGRVSQSDVVKELTERIVERFKETFDISTQAQSFVILSFIAAGLVFFNLLCFYVGGKLGTMDPNLLGAIYFTHWLVSGIAALIAIGAYLSTKDFTFWNLIGILILIEVCVFTIMLFVASFMISAMTCFYWLLAAIIMLCIAVAVYRHFWKYELAAGDDDDWDW